ncbi:MAG: biotin-dependent carboxyltransferase family protein [Saccharopolyspora sp.]|uniref:5-oxoprolinase subunit C family protein n=1 Tax=Saccharopolyspora sp. TaxID=33915 RepID=UPI0025F452DB|nr:biotin-dependent carboxyltransferase family protein [Saccharopolyspora sp.]MBQ6644556.1 biotin-dependent carboxyltransferase family protein [Saccharopolyspora sp.]
MLTATPSTLEVVDPGPLSTVQDLGRTGYAHLGVSPSGAADPESLRLANRLVGNPAGTPALECTLGGLSLRFTAARWVALAGAPASALVDERPVVDPRRFRVPAGQVLHLGRPSIGLRSYLAVGGGFLVRRVLGGAGHDVLAGHGPAPLRPGDELAIGPDRPQPAAPIELANSRCPSGIATLRFGWGPRHELFDAADRERFTTTRWRISTESNRIGVRLLGEPLRIGEVRLASEGMVPGAIQVPPSGEPIAFLADHPVTGGYPVIGVLTEPDIGLLAQAPPGTAIRFRSIPGTDAPAPVPHR